jgi:L-2,4-diaminobutyrate decarboxylase
LDMSIELQRSRFELPEDATGVVRLLQRTLAAIFDPASPIAHFSDDVSLAGMDGATLPEVVAQACEIARTGCVNPRHTNNIAHMVPPPSTVSVIADLLIGALNQCAFISEEGPSVGSIERAVLDWMARQLGLGGSVGSLLTSGGTASNLLAVFLARSRCRFVPHAQLRIIASDQVHLSVDKAARIIGLSPHAVVKVKTTRDGRIPVGAIAQAAQDVRKAGAVPFCFICTAGTTNAGVVESSDEFSDVSNSLGAWLHVDAAYGGVLCLTERGAAICQKWGDAQSISWDPHKSLYVSYASGALFVRDARDLAALEVRSDYALRENSWEDPGHRHLDGSRRFEALKVWMAIRLFGVTGFRTLATHTFEIARAFERAANKATFLEVLAPPDLNIVCFRFAYPGLTESDLDDINASIQRGLFHSNGTLLSTTRLSGSIALRAVFSNPMLHESHLAEIITTIQLAGLELVATRAAGGTIGCA